MADETVGLLLAELRGVREEVAGFREEIAAWRQETAERVTALETHVKTGIVGNGTPSRLTVLEGKVSDLQKIIWIGTAVVIFIQIALNAVIHFWPKP